MGDSVDYHGISSKFKVSCSLVFISLTEYRLYFPYSFTISQFGFKEWFITFMILSCLFVYIVKQQKYLEMEEERAHSAVEISLAGAELRHLAIVLYATDGPTDGPQFHHTKLQEAFVEMVVQFRMFIRKVDCANDLEEWVAIDAMELLRDPLEKMEYLLPEV